MKKILTVVLLIVLIAGAYYAFYTKKPAVIKFENIDSTQLPHRKVILIGLDGATWDVLQPLIDAGWVPNIKSLLEKGTKADFYTRYSAFSPVIWASVATGKLPEKHGIKNFLVSTPGEYEEIPATSIDRKTNAIWNILSHFGKKVSVTGWWASWPAEKVNGYMVSQKFFLNVFQAGPIGAENDMKLGKISKAYTEGSERLTYPDSLADELKNNMAAASTEKFESSDFYKLLNSALSSEKDPYREDHLKSMLNIYKADFMGKEVFSYLNGKDRNIDFQAVYFEGVDASSHFFWKEFDESKKIKGSAFNSIIEQYYIVADGYVGEILKASDSNTDVIIVSDHGFEKKNDSRSRVFQLNRVLEKLGFLKMLEDGNIDYSNSSCFDSQAFPKSNMREIKINFAGIFPGGSVKTEEDAKKIYEDLKDRLGKLTLANGGKLVEDISYDSTKKIINVKVKYQLPSDDMIKFEDAGVSVDKLFDLYDLSGDHNPKGIFLSAGIDIINGNAKEGREVTTLDVTPTILSIFGLPVGTDMDGKIISSILNETSGDKAYRGVISSYDSHIPLQNLKASVSGGSDKLMKERLKSLGYIN
ncbi:MAG: alkaline phosphatase family protein [Candidatus Schekmanbacteria bacterium]|nr:alkaline phosphatase family protein [Candidatus Schekmanbacteria bacterium]